MGTLLKPNEHLRISKDFRWIIYDPDDGEYEAVAPLTSITVAKNEQHISLFTSRYRGWTINPTQHPKLWAQVTAFLETL